jgi:hypothetical protein
VLGTFALAVVAGIIGYRAYLGLLNPGVGGLPSGKHTKNTWKITIFYS